MSIATPSQDQIQRGRIPLGRRHSRYDPSYGRLVQFLKVLLPTLALVLVTLVVTWPVLTEQMRQVTASLSLSGDEKPGSMQITNARYTSLDDKEQPFTLTADAVRQSGVDSPIVMLERPKADIMLADQSWAAITALNGEFDRTRQVLQLSGDVNFFHDLGYEFRTAAADFDFVQGRAYGDEPVEGQGPFGLVEAEGFRIHDRGARVELTGRSRLVIFTDGDGP